MSQPVTQDDAVLQLQSYEKRIHAIERLVNDAFVYSTAPTGTVFAYIDDEPPDGFFMCEGDPIDLAAWPDLFAHCGFKFTPVSLGGPGVDPGGNIFYLPDTQGRNIVGLGQHVDVSEIGNSDSVALSGRTPRHKHDASGLAITSTFTGDAVGNHTHVQFQKAATGVEFATGPAVDGTSAILAEGFSPSTYGGGAHTPAGDVDSAASGTVGASEDPTDAEPYIILAHIIKN